MLFGIIPARAGFTTSRVQVAVQALDHPRSRGVYEEGKGLNRYYKGSSPLARGLHKEHTLGVHAFGIIPARAGFTCGIFGGVCGAEDHPRSRGVYIADVSLETTSEGSSPLARGLQYYGKVRNADNGIIPARAGFT